MSLSRWDRFVWPKWLPETARMPLIAQVTGAVALTALIMGPWWSRVPSEPPAATTLPATTPAAPAVPLQPAVTPAPPVTQATSRPAHLNLDVRHSFASVDFSVTVDGKRVLDSKLEGSGKKFKMFGKRDVRSFTRSLDLTPGVRVVNVRLKSADDRFDQTRTERFDLGSASVASMRITAGKDGLDVIAQHPAPQPAQPAATSESAATMPVTAAAAVPVPAGLPSASAQRADAVAELLNSLRSMLIAIAGFVASAATGFVVQEYMRSRKNVIFTGPRRRRRTSEEEPADAIEAP